MVARDLSLSCLPRRSWRRRERSRRKRAVQAHALIYLSGIAGKRLSVLLVGSTMIPTDSSAVTPKSGSVPGAAKTTRPAVVSPMNSIRTRPKGYSLTVPSANSYAIFPSCLTPSFSSSSEGAIESVAPVSTRKSDSNDFCESTRLVSFVVTFVNPIPPGKYHCDQLTAMMTIPATLSSFPAHPTSARATCVNASLLHRQFANKVRCWP
jgi:hypothetical protein